MSRFSSLSSTSRILGTSSSSARRLTLAGRRAPHDQAVDSAGVPGPIIGALPETFTARPSSRAVSPAGKLVHDNDDHQGAALGLVAPQRQPVGDRSAARSCAAGPSAHPCRPERGGSPRGRGGGSLVGTSSGGG